jgi:hypothetical protein
MSSFRFFFAAATVLASFCAACDQKVDKGDNKLTTGKQSVSVVYNNGIEEAARMVEFDHLTTVYKFNDTPVVSMTDVVKGSGLVLSTDGLWLNFVGSDGYSPLGNDNCGDAFTPTPASIIGSAYIERGTRNMLWDEALEAPSCMSVKDVETVYVADDPADLPVGGDSDGDSDSDTDVDTDVVGHIIVDFDGATEDVAFDGLETAELDGATVVLLPAIFAQTAFVFDPGAVSLSFEGSDGYNPTEEGTCTEALPAPGTLSGQAGINTASNDLEWDPALEFPGCAHVKETAIVYITSN